jgi:hypothetical protein
MAGSVYITGTTAIGIGFTTTLTIVNATNNGVWSSSDLTIATIITDVSNSLRCVVTGVAAGTAIITYTQGINTYSVQVTVSVVHKITNGFNPDLVLGALQNEVLWSSQGVSNSGRYFPDFHPICDETILKALCNTGGDYSAFLSSLNNSVVMDCVNAVYNAPQLIDKSKLVFQRSDIMLVTQPVQNQNPPQFVGLKFQLAPGDYGIKCSNLMLFFNEAITFPIYLYNDFDAPPMYSLNVTTKANQQVIINLANDVFLNYLTPTINKGGIWYLGYYQSDVITASATAKAIYYPIVINRFHVVNCWSFSASTTDGGTNFNRNVVGANNLTYGMNLEISTMEDATNNIVQNPSLWDNLFGLRMACRIIENCKMSYRSNNVQGIIQSLGGVDALNKELEGSKGDWQTGSPKITGLRQRVNDAVQTVKQGFEPEYFGGVGLISID